MTHYHDTWLELYPTLNHFNGSTYLNSFLASTSTSHLLSLSLPLLHPVTTPFPRLISTLFLPTTFLFPPLAPLSFSVRLSLPASPILRPGMTYTASTFTLSLAAYCTVMCHQPVSVSLYSYIYLRILIISYFATFRGTNVLMCCKAVNQSINFPIPLYPSKNSSNFCLTCRTSEQYGGYVQVRVIGLNVEEIVQNRSTSVLKLSGNFDGWMVNKNCSVC